MRENRWRQFDFLLVACVALLISYGVAMIHSATCGSPCPGLFPPSSWALRHGVFGLIGLAVLGVVSLLDYRSYRLYAYHLFGLACALLILVLFVGRAGADDDYGARRWIYLGVFDLQASEIGKLGLLAALARIFAQRAAGPLSTRLLLGSLVLVAIPAGLVFIEPDLGTALSYLVVWATLVVVVGIRARQAMGLTFGLIVALPLAWLAMRDYMRERVLTYIGTLVDLEHAAFDQGYNVLQARISIGSGGLFGRGYLEGTQTQLDYLRIKQSDFIFSALAEELGFIGSALLLALFVLLLFRIARAADRSQDEFGRLLALGIGAMLLFQCVANLGANLTLLPVTGIPLPFISYGRTALMTDLIAMGMVQSILLYRLKYRY